MWVYKVFKVLLVEEEKSRKSIFVYNCFSLEMIYMRFFYSLLIKDLLYGIYLNGVKVGICGEVYEIFDEY